MRQLALRMNRHKVRLQQCEGISILHQILRLGHEH